MDATVLSGMIAAADRRAMIALASGETAKIRSAMVVRSSSGSVSELNAGIRPAGLLWQPLDEEFAEQSVIHHVVS